MRSFEQVSAIRAYVRGMRVEGKVIGFVPTMGALHEGHLSLMKKAKADCDVVIASIFVNPTQFGPDEDLTAYPRTLARDQQLTSNVGLDAMFVPSTSEMYPDGFQTVVDVPVISATLEGAHRPGHFRGVSTVVLKLINIVQPDRVYFGQKDYQQVLVVERMARDLNVNAEIVTVSTVRESDGLALSSRNAYLSPEEREAAPVLYRALELARARVAEGITDVDSILTDMNTLIAAQPLATTDYVAMVHPDTLLPVAEVNGASILAVLAVKIGKTRLIDNMLISTNGLSVLRPRTPK